MGVFCDVLQTWRILPTLQQWKLRGSGQPDIKTVAGPLLQAWWDWEAKYRILEANTLIYNIVALERPV